MGLFSLAVDAPRVDCGRVWFVARGLGYTYGWTMHVSFLLNL